MGDEEESLLGVTVKAVMILSQGGKAKVGVNPELSDEF